MSGSMFSKQWFRVAKLKPKTRSNVATHRHYYRGETWYVLSSKTNQQHMRIDAGAFYLFSQFDGERSVDEVWQSGLAALGEDAPSQDELLNLLSEMFDSTFLDFQKQSDVDQLFDNLQRKLGKDAKSRYWNPLFLRFGLFDPDRLSAKLLPALSWAFTRTTFHVWIALCLISVVAAWYTWSDISIALSGDLVSPNNLMIIWFVFPIMKLLHELAHALAVKRWGGEVHEFGIALLVLLPVPYVDASDSAGFANKYRRMAVAGAGIVVESTMACIALLLWLAVEPGLIKDIAFNVMLTGSVSCLLFNGNPLLKFDSYYVLSDAIEIPSLATRSTRYLMYLIQRYALGLESSSPVTAQGERRWFITYGLTAFFYRISLSIGICLFVASEYFFFGIALAAWAALMQLVLPVLKGLKFLLTDPRLRNRRMRAYSASAASAALAFGLLFLIQFPHVTQVRGVVWPVDEAMVRAETECFVRNVTISNGALVTPGEVLLHCDTELLESELASLQAEHTAARATLYATRDRVERSLAQSEIDTTQKLLAKAENKLAKTNLASTTHGTLYLTDSENLVGRYFEQGALLGYVLNDKNVSIRTMLGQERVNLLGDRLEDVEIARLRPTDKPLPSKVVRRVPAATDRLTTPALGVDGGGDLMVQTDGSQGSRLQQAAFELEIELPVEVRNSLVGEPIQVRFDHGDESIATLMYRQVQLLLLSRFNV